MSHQARGLVLLLPRTGLTVVPFDQKSGGGWDVVVIDGTETYPRGVYHQFISGNEIETAIELAVGDAIETTFIYTPEEADALPNRESILTPGGIVFRKWDDYQNDGEAAWTRFLHPPVGTDDLDATLHFPAKVLGTAPAKESADV